MHELYLRAVVPDELPPLLADGVRHDDDRVIALDRADEREPDALVAAGGLDDHGVRVQQPGVFRLLDHVQRGARLDGAAHVQTLELHEDLRAARLRHPVKAHERGMPHRLQNVVVYHEKSSFLRLELKV